MEVIVKVDTEKCPMTFLERMEMIREIQDKMQDIPDIGNTMSATTFAPSLKAKRSGPLVSKVMVRNALNTKLEQHRQEYIDGDFLDEDGSQELWRIRARVGALNDVDYGEFKNDIRARVEPVLAAWRTQIGRGRRKEGCRR